MVANVTYSLMLFVLGLAIGWAIRHVQTPAPNEELLDGLFNDTQEGFDAAINRAGTFADDTNSAWNIYRLTFCGTSYLLVPTDNEALLVEPYDKIYPDH